MLFTLSLMMVLFLNSSFECVSDQGALQIILDSKEVENFLHPEAEGRIPLYVLQNDRVKEGYQLQKFGEDVVITNDIEKHKNYLEVVELSIYNCQIKFVLWYEIEGAELSGLLRKTGKNWEMKEFNFIEL